MAAAIDSCRKSRRDEATMVTNRWARGFREPNAIATEAEARKKATLKGMQNFIIVRTMNAVHPDECPLNVFQVQLYHGQYKD